MLPAYDLLMLLVLVSMMLLGAIKGFAWSATISPTRIATKWLPRSMPSRPGTFFSRCC
jgi:hypothetical protein